MYNPAMVKQSMIESLKDYVANGTPKGGFLTAVLCNDLYDAAARADDENFETLAHVTGWCYNNIPRIAFGSEAKYIRWLEVHERMRDKEGYGNYSLHDTIKELDLMEQEEEEEEEEEE